MQPLPSGADQLRLFSEVEGDQGQPLIDRKYHLLPLDWFIKWKAHCKPENEHPGPSPGPIDTSCLGSSNDKLALGFDKEEGRDFILVIDSAFAKLKEWYGVEGDEFARSVAKHPDGTRVEYFPVKCKVQILQVPPHSINAEVSVYIPRPFDVREMLELLCAARPVRDALGSAMPLSPSAARLWWFTKPADMPMLMPDKLQDIIEGTAEEPRLLFEIRNQDGSWPRGVWPYPDRVDAVAAGKSWSMGIKVGSFIDAKDSDGNWFAARVDACTFEDEANGPSEDDMLKIHFIEWSATFDISVKRESDGLSPLHTNSRFWRHSARPGDRIEVRVCDKNAVGSWSYKWYLGWVLDIDNAQLPPVIAVALPGDAVTNAYSKPGESASPTIQCSLLGEEVTCIGTHTTLSLIRTLTRYSPTAGVVVPPTPACMPYTEVTNDLLAQLLKLDVQFPPSPFSAPQAPLRGTSTSTQITSFAPVVRPLAITTYGTTSVNTLRPSWSTNNYNDDPVVEEEPSIEGKDPREVMLEKRRFYTDGVTTAINRYRTVGHAKAAGSPPGVCGLENLGNTCFMNSMIQCLSNVEPLTRFFIDDDGARYLREINTENILGSKGQLAHAYGALMHAMWSGDFQIVSPGPVKAYVARKAPQFIGYQQHDSQEFMSFLMDGLLEDTCRIPGARKPIVPEVESAGRTDAEIAAETWRNYLARNASQVADTFGGQYRSHLVCNECGYTSVVFDPFTSVSVPVPVELWKAYAVYLFSESNSRPPIKMQYWASDKDTAGDLAAFMYTRLVALQTPEMTEALPAGPHELLVTGSSPDPCLIRMVIPHTAPLRGSLQATKAYINDTPNIMVWHVPGVAPKNTSVDSVPEAWAAAYHTQVAARLADDGGDDAEGSGNLQSKKDAPAAAVAMPDAAVPGSPGPGLLTRQTSKQAVPKTVPAGPAMWEFVPVWLRKAGTTYNPRTYAREQSWTSMGDNLVISLPAVIARQGGLGPPTNRSIRAEIWRKVQRYAFPRCLSQFNATSDAFHIHYFEFDNTKRGVLDKELAKEFFVYPGSRLELPDDDSPFVWQPGLQLTCDFDNLALSEALMDPSAPSRSVPDQVSISAPPPPKQLLTLVNCLERFSQREQLGEEDQWYCRACKKHVRAYKKMDLWKMPPVLIVHMKRFLYERGIYSSGHIRSKIGELVDFPVTGLDLSSFAMGAQDIPPIYDLFAVSDHSGDLGGGHYTAHAQNFIDKKWYCFDDSRVSVVSSKSAVQPSAYVLFFRRREPGSPPPLDFSTAGSLVQSGVSRFINAAVDNEDIDMQD